MNPFFSMLFFLYNVLQGIIAFYLLIPAFMVLAYFVLKLFRSKTPFERRSRVSEKNHRFGIIITAHQDMRFVPPAVDSILKQTYQNFHVFVVADDCVKNQILIDSPKVTILYPETPLHSKIKSIHYALDFFPEDIDNIIILDADNLLHPDFFHIMNSYFQKGYQAVQCDFQPKNTNTVFARMDAVGDMYNFFLEREMRFRLNVSATIWGAGLAIDRKLYESVEYRDFLGGFDKKLQSHIMERVDRIAYAREAVLYDEKVESGPSLEKQRTRWISSYFKYFQESLKMLWQGIKLADLNKIYFAIILLRPPLFIVLGASFLFTFAALFYSLTVFFLWLSVLLIYLLSFVAIIYIRSRDWRYVSTLLTMPMFMARQILALLNMNKAKKSFLKTEHTNMLYIDDLLKERAGKTSTGRRI